MKSNMKRKWFIYLVLIIVLSILLVGCPNNRNVPSSNYTLNITTEGRGVVEKNPDKSSYEENEAVELTAVPEDSWKFDHWEGGGFDGENSESISFVMDSDYNIKAIFEGISESKTAGNTGEIIFSNSVSLKNINSGDSVTMQEVTPPKISDSGLEVVGKVVDITYNGDIPQDGVILQIPLDKSEPNTGLYHFNSESEEWEFISYSEIIEKKGQEYIQGIVNEFSKYTALTKNELSYSEINELLEKAADDNNLPPILLKAIAYQESNWNHYWTAAGEQPNDNHYEYWPEGEDCVGKVKVRIEDPSDTYPYGAYGIGIMQYTIPLNKEGNPTDQDLYDKLKNNIEYNIKKGAERLSQKWEESQKNPLEIENSNDIIHIPIDNPNIIENWWYATYWYNGEGGDAKEYTRKISDHMSSPPDKIKQYMEALDFTLPFDVNSDFSIGDKENNGDYVSALPEDMFLFLEDRIGEVIEGEVHYWKKENIITSQDPRIKEAIKWSFDHLNSGDYPFLCLSFVKKAYDIKDLYNQVKYTFEYAKEAAEKTGAAANKGKPIPRGSYVYFDWYGIVDGIYDNWGHVGIALGDGQIIHAYGEVRVDKISEMPYLDDFDYIGWAWPSLTPPIDNGNNSPTKPELTSPSNGTIDVDTSLTLSWEESTDPEGDSITYDVYFDTSSTPSTKVEDSISSTCYDVSGLNQDTTYYWKIVAKDGNGNSTESSTWSFTTAGDNTVITFEDPDLEEVIRDKIDKPTGDIYKSDVEDITTLEAPNSDIDNLSGIENFINLEWLNLGYEWVDGSRVNSNSISDINPVSDLINLVRLYFGNNQVSDISPVSNLTNLYHIDFSYNQVSDISPVSNLTNLVGLWSNYNQVSDISSVSNLNNLTDLNVSSNQVSDISPLVNNSGIDLGDNIDVRYNNLYLSEGSEDMDNINTLLDREVDLAYEPQN